MEDPIIDVVGDPPMDNHDSRDSSEEPDDGPTTIEISTTGERKYFCQRCLNHGFEHPRKGHKPHCKFAKCTCHDCIMVERRRQLNNMLSKCNPAVMKTEIVNGKKTRIPCCSRCACHGTVNPLKGHKKALCPFRDCECKTCGMVTLRRNCMAAQVKLRRGQSKSKLVCFSIKENKVTAEAKERKRRKQPLTTVVDSMEEDTSVISSPPPDLSPSTSSLNSSCASSPAPVSPVHLDMALYTPTIHTTTTSITTAPLPSGIVIPTPILPPLTMLPLLSLQNTLPAFNHGLPAPRAIKPTVFTNPAETQFELNLNPFNFQFTQIDQIRQLLNHFGQISIPHSN